MRELAKIKVLGEPTQRAEINIPKALSNVCYWHLADIDTEDERVCFWE
jgi:hypothetical protein